MWCNSASLLCCIELCGCHSTLVVYSADVPYGCYLFVRTFAHIHCSLLVVLLWITSVGSEAQFVPLVPDRLVVGVGSVAQCTRFRETTLRRSCNCIVTILGFQCECVFRIHFTYLTIRTRRPVVRFAITVYRHEVCRRFRSVVMWDRFDRGCI